MKKVIWVLLSVLLVSALIFGGCTKAAPAPASAPAPAPAPSPTPTPAPAPTAAPAPAAAVKPIVWEYYTPSVALVPSGPDGVMGGSGALMNMVDEIEQATKGRIKVKVLKSGEHPYKAPDFIKLIKDLHPPLLQLGFGQVAGDDARLSVADLPMLFPPDQDVFYQVIDKKLMPEFLTPILAKDYGYQPFVTFSWTPQRLGGRDFFVTSWDSLKKKKIRTWNAQLVDWVALLGGTGVSVALGEVYTGLQTGLVDGIISSSAGLSDNAWGEVCKNLTMMEVQFGLVPFIVSQKALNDLPADVRTDFLTWAKGAEPRARKVYQASVSAGTLDAVTKMGVQIARPSPDFWNDVRSKCDDAVWKKWVARSGGAGSPAADALNKTVQMLTEMGYKVPYKP